MHVLGTVPEFVPVRLDRTGGFRCAEEEAIFKAEIEARAAALRADGARWPPELPADTDWAMLVATYAKQTGRVVAYSMAAFRQAFAAGRDLGERDWVLIAAAAAEMHPTAVIKAAALRGIRGAARRRHRGGRGRGRDDVPAVRVGDAGVPRRPRARARGARRSAAPA